MYVPSAVELEVAKKTNNIDLLKLIQHNSTESPEEQKGEDLVTKIQNNTADSQHISGQFSPPPTSGMLSPVPDNSTDTIPKMSPEM